MLLGFVEVRLDARWKCGGNNRSNRIRRVVRHCREELGERLEAVMALGADWSEEEAASVAASM